MTTTSTAHNTIHKTNAFQSIVDKKAASGAGVVQGNTKICFSNDIEVCLQSKQLQIFTTVHNIVGINVKTFNTVGTPNTKGSLILNAVDNGANLHNARNCLDLVTKH